MSEQRASDLEPHPTPDAGPDHYWTKIGRVNDILSVVCFPLALFSGLTGFGVLTYCGVIELPGPGTGPASPKVETRPEPASPSPDGANAARKEARIDARIAPKQVKTINMSGPAVAKGTDGDTTPEEMQGSEQTSPSPDAKSARAMEGWIYAGAYPTESYYLGPYYKGPCRSGGCPTGWTSRYLDFSEKTVPHDLKGKALHPLKHSNVRTDHPSQRGVAAAFGVVAPDTRLVVSEVFLKNRGQEVWLKVKIFGSVLPLNVAGLGKSASGGH